MVPRRSATNAALILTTAITIAIVIGALMMHGDPDPAAASATASPPECVPTAETLAQAAVSDREARNPGARTSEPMLPVTTCNIHGRVLLTGAGVADGASVTLVPAAIWPAIRSELATTAAADGTFEFFDVTCGEWVLLASHTDFVDSFVFLPRQPAGGYLAVHPILERGLTATTIVLDHDGSPLAGCRGHIALLNRSQAWSPGTSASGSQTMTERTVVSGSDGRMTCPGLAAADWRLIVEHPAHPSARLAFTLTGEHCTLPAAIRLPGTPLRGECLLDGQVVAGTNLRLPDGLGPGRPVVVSTDDAGRFVTPPLAIGAQRLLLEDFPAAAEIETQVVVGHPQTCRLSFLTDPRPTSPAATGTLVVLALGRDGRPTRAMVELRIADANGRSQVVREATDDTVTDALGHVTFSNLGPGDYIARCPRTDVTTALSRVMNHTVSRVLLTIP